MLRVSDAENRNPFCYNSFTNKHEKDMVYLRVRIINTVRVKKKSRLKRDFSDPIKIQYILGSLQQNSSAR